MKIGNSGFAAGGVPHPRCIFIGTYEHRQPICGEYNVSVLSSEAVSTDDPSAENAADITQTLTASSRLGFDGAIVDFLRQLFYTAF